MKPYSPIYKPKQWIKVRLDENLRLSDFQNHAGLSKFTKWWKDERLKKKGGANISARLVKLIVNTKKDYVTFRFYSAPTYSFTAKFVKPQGDMKPKGKTAFYVQDIRILDFFKWARTTPGYQSAKELSVDDLKEIFKVADIQVWCNCPSQIWQGMNYYLSTFDASVVPTTIAPKSPVVSGGKVVRWGWKDVHNAGDNLVCKHLSMLLVSIKFWMSPMASMLNKYLNREVTNK